MRTFKGTQAQGTGTGTHTYIIIIIMMTWKLTDGRDYPNDSIAKNGQNSETSPGDLWRLEEPCCHSNSSEKPSANTDVKNSKGVNDKYKDKYLDLARELKKLWNMKVTIVPIVIGAFGTVIEGLRKGLEDLEVGGRVETIQTQHC